ncbi:acylhydrolase [Burkholderia sp. Leaf177]|uniref:SGNH/GDSL hydrolase family protein n=1 Tax=Burkholderia sp. Leaf177 TaxID=1736287 RepID=UPI0006FB878A|nr:acylhydrolase [Burkholderia sp. Leaf177]
MKPAKTIPAARQAYWLRAVQTAMACAAIATLAACGGGDDNNDNTPAGGVKLQVVSFGDSLSDVGTYAPVATANFGGGRFTTNPGQVWTQNVAQYYGDTLAAANTGGFGVPLQAASGFGYAQGGSRVTLQPGVGHATPGTANADFSQATTIPVNDQVSQYIASHGTFNANQLVLVNGGANDIFYNLTVAQATAAGIQAQVAAGTITPAQAATAGAAATTAATTAISQAAIDLATVVGRVVQAGATHVLVSNVPDIGGSPQGLASADKGATLSQVTQLFNGTLQGALQKAGLLSKVIYVDAYAWIDGVQANYQSNGFSVSNTGTACNLSAMIAAATKAGQPNPTAFGTSLFCSPQTYTVANADQTYMYADTVHPTTHLHALFSTFVEQQIAKAGLGK